MIGRMYSVQFNAVAITAAQDLFEINCASTKVTLVHEVHLSQTSDFGDAQEEILLIKMISGYSTSGSGGSTPTAIPFSLGDSAFAGTVEVNNTTQANTGSAVTHCVWGWNVRIPFDVIFTPEARKPIAPSGRLVVTIPAPADSLTVNGYMVIEEIG